MTRELADEKDWNIAVMHGQYSQGECREDLVTLRRIDLTSYLNYLSARHLEELRAYELTVSNLRTELAGRGVLSDDARQQVIEAVADALGDAYDCMRVWSAWRVGTMTENDFSPSAQNHERVAEIADAAIDAMLTAAQPDLLQFAVMRWTEEVKNRPLQNKHRRTLDDTWRQVIRFAGGEPDALVGLAHDALIVAAAPQPPERHDTRTT